MASTQELDGRWIHHDFEGNIQNRTTLRSHTAGAFQRKTKRSNFAPPPKNYQDRLQGFSYDELPKTFQDAVRVTRELGKQYLWIDALCIIQGPGGDWESEATTMEDIFACAYCTIAASSASGWGDGFLKSNPGSQYPSMQGIAGGQTCTCSFDKDVDEGSLMKRAWVLQERVLSRRIIHFAATHTYWECGDGVRCEQFKKLTPPFGKQYFILDSAFPTRLTEAGYLRSVDFVRFFFEKYSRSGLTVKSDRDTAILSLVNRMGRAFDTKVSCGIIRCFLGSLLLWKRTDGEMTAPIDYKDKRTVPSWSWMAYSGGIDFFTDGRRELKIPRSADLDLSDDADDDGKALNVKVRQFENCRLEQEGTEHAIFDAAGQVGSLWFDLAGRHEFRHCVVVGMTSDQSKQDHEKTYYVLMVREKQDGGEYERVGVGKVEAAYVSTRCEDGKLL
ncbi:hypothetical protein CEP52_016707 [Fusarium oligoseptatum]|uniref:Heterokaryon incompatibility domain-containing protein n=1 Tax=Fusarium oligoseptatum TaxID=2604345 RepID=A0A428S0Y2_9HYPO|nr:hypothetical protein CEP52_016707 [Fusarium oligoseptatum]